MRRRTFLAAVGVPALAGCTGIGSDGDGSSPPDGQSQDGRSPDGQGAGGEPAVRRPFEGVDRRLDELGRWFVPFDRVNADPADSYTASVTHPQEIQERADDLGSQADFLQRELPSDLGIETRSADRVIAVDADATSVSTWPYVLIEREVDLASVEESVAVAASVERTTVGEYTFLPLESGYWLGVGDTRLLAVAAVGPPTAEDRSRIEGIVEPIGGSSRPLYDQLGEVQTVADRVPTAAFTHLRVRASPAHEIGDRAAETFSGWTVTGRSIDVGTDRYGERFVLYFPEFDRSAIEDELFSYRAVFEAEGWEVDVEADGAVGVATRTIALEDLPY